MISKDIFHDFLRRNILLNGVFIFLISVLLLYFWADTGSLNIILISLLCLIIVLLTQKKIVLKITLFIFYLYFIFTFSNFINPSSIKESKIKICGYISDIEKNKIKLFNVKINDKKSTRTVYLRVDNKTNKFSRYQHICANTENNIVKYRRYDYLVKTNVDTHFYEGNKTFAELIEKISTIIDKTLDKYFGEDSGIVKALVFGVKKDLESDEKKSFQDVGIGHLLVASGANILIIMVVIKYAFSFLRGILNPFILTTFELAACLIYLLVVGLESSLTRAFVFWLYIYVEEIIGRSVNFALKMLYCIVFISLIIPENIFSIGLFLSIAAVIGIKLSNDIIIISKIKNEFIKILILNIFILLCVSIITSYYFAQVNLVGIISNVLIGPLVEVIVSTAFLVSLFCFMFGNVDYLFIEEILNFLAVLVGYLVKSLRGLVTFIESLPFISSMNVNFHLDSTGIMIGILSIALFWLLIKIKLLEILRKDSQI